MRRVKPYTEETFHFKDCMGVGGQLAVSPQGKIGPCQAYLGCDEYFPLDVHALHAKLPDLSIEDIYADPMFHEWSYRFPLNMKDCIDCHAIAVCGGGCPYAAHANTGSIWKIDKRICFQAKQIFEWMIWETYDAMVAEQMKP
ncbi:MAG: SPASM domain-containing protein [Planctomycetaceae bacterium]|nr:SPASM domain-containing protein [Planctomycetaceae bacterium]